MARNIRKLHASQGFPGRGLRFDLDYVSASIFPRAQPSYERWRKQAMAHVVSMCFSPKYCCGCQNAFPQVLATGGGLWTMPKCFPQNPGGCQEHAQN